MPRFIEFHSGGQKVLVNEEKINFMMKGRLGFDYDYINIDESYQKAKDIIEGNMRIDFDINHVSYEPWQMGREQ